MSKPIIKVKHVNFRYHNSSSLVLKDVSFQIIRGNWTSIIGTNGSGKSTLIKVIDGLLAPQKGKVQIDGHWLTSKNVWQLRSKIGIVFQNPADQFVNTTVKDDLAFGLENFRISSNQIASAIDIILHLVGMSSFKNSLLQNLSGGQKQRIALAEVLVTHPQVIVLDESTSMLNPLGRYRILHLIKDLKQRFHLTVLDITHNIEETKYANQVIVLNHGQLIMDGKPEYIFNHDSELKRMGLMLPQVDILKELLIRKRIPLPNVHLDENEMIKWLRKLL